MSEHSSARWIAPNLGQGESPSTPMTVDTLEALQQSAHEEAFAQGLEAGRQAGLEALAAQAQLFSQYIEALEEPFRQLDDEVERTLVDLAVRISRQIIRREFNANPEHIVGVVREAVGLLPVAARGVKVCLHPDDAAVVRGVFGETGTNLSWTLVEDPVLTRGGLKIVTETSQIDARVEARLDNLLASLVGGEREDDPQ